MQKIQTEIARRESHNDLLKPKVVKRRIMREKSPTMQPEETAKSQA